MTNCLYFAELPSGVPVLSGQYGFAHHKPNCQPFFLFFDDWDFLYTKKGSADFQMRNRRLLHLPEDHFLLLPPGIPLWLQPPPSPLSLGFLHFSFLPTPPNLFPSTRRDCLEIGRKVVVPSVFAGKAAPGLVDAYLHLQGLSIVEGRPWRFASAMGAMMAEFGRYALAWQTPRDHVLWNASANLDRRVLNVCRRISQNPAQPWMVAHLARSVNLSVGHLERLFYSNLRINLKRFIINRRLEHAGRLLLVRNEDGNSSIKEISTAAGFASQQFFARQFKKFHGLSPMAFRLRSRKSSPPPPLKRSARRKARSSVSGPPSSKERQ